MAINPKIKQKAEDIRSKIFGAEVRESLASGIEAISEDVEATIGRQGYVEEQFQDVLDETTGKDVISAPELIAARNGKSNLKTRLDDEHAQVTAQLQQKVDKVILDTETYSLKFYASDKLINAINVTEATNIQTVQDYIDSLVTAGTISGVTIGEKAVTFTNLNDDLQDIISDAYLVTDSKYKNLFDKNNVTKNKFVNAVNGALQDHTSYSVGEIKVRGNTQYIKNSNPTGAWYNASGVFIQGIPFDEPQPMVSPENARILRVSARNSELNEFVVVQGEQLPEFPIPYYKDVGNNYIRKTYRNSETQTLKSVKDIVYSILANGGIIDLWGDSRTHGAGGTGFAQVGDLIPGTDVKQSPNGHSWANSLRDLLAEKYGVTVRNWGQHGKNSTHFHNQMETLTNQNPDVILMMLGTNDRHNLPNVEETKRLQREMINLAHAKGIKVVLMSAAQTSPTEDSLETKNYHMYDLDKAMNELAREYDMDYISNYDNSLKYNEYTNTLPDDILSDGLHENDLGHDIIFRNVVRSFGISYDYLMTV